MLTEIATLRVFGDFNASCVFFCILQSSYCILNSISIYGIKRFKGEEKLEEN